MCAREHTFREFSSSSGSITLAFGENMEEGMGAGVEGTDGTEEDEGRSVDETSAVHE